MIQPRTTQGVMELLPAQQLAFQRMLDTIRRGFERFGFSPIETPVFELTDVLLTKSGGETEKQVYFVQSTGSIEQGHKPELALRFDLTVPLARFVAEHEAKLNFPFRRYQIQRVYRGERAQKGRYREFYQCDIDVIGKDTLGLKHDAELPGVIYGIFQELDFGKFTIKLNNRKLLRGLLEARGVSADKHEAVLHEIDRLGKLSVDEVLGRLSSDEVGMQPADARQLLEVLTFEGSGREILAKAGEAVPSNDGLAELTRVYDLVLAAGVPETHVAIDLSIARGLDYYTGTVYETFLDDQPRLGSICSGGRYDNLAGHYTKSKLPGVGISIGVTRLFSKLMEELAAAEKDPAQLAAVEKKLYGARAPAVADVIVLQLDEKLAGECAAIASELRRDFNVELYGNDGKLDKQLKYANRARIPFAILLGASEQERGVVQVKDLRKHSQTDVPRAELTGFLRSQL